MTVDNIRMNREIFQIRHETTRTEERNEYPVAHDPHEHKTQNT